METLWSNRRIGSFHHQPTEKRERDDDKDNDNERQVQRRALWSEGERKAVVPTNRKQRKRRERDDNNNNGERCGLWSESENQNKHVGRTVSSHVRHGQNDNDDSHGCCVSFQPPPEQPQSQHHYRFMVGLAILTGPRVWQFGDRGRHIMDAACRDAVLGTPIARCVVDRRSRSGRSHLL